MDPTQGPPTAGVGEAAAAPRQNAIGSTSTNGTGTGTGDAQGRKKRARESRRSNASSPAAVSAPAAASHAPHVDALAHIDLVVYAGYEIRAQYPSPYPLEELPGATTPASTLTSGAATNAAAAATQTRENGGRFGGGEKAAPPNNVIENDNDNDGDGGKAPNGSKAPTPPPPPRGSSTEVSALGMGVVAGREISPELAAPTAAAAAPPPPPVGATPMQIDPASESAAASMAPQIAAAPESVAVAETPTPSPLETIPPASLPPAPPPPSSSSADASPASNAPPIASTSALAYPIRPTPPPPPPQTVPTSRGSRGRFLPKPPGETVKAKRAAERAARLAAAAGKDAASPHAHAHAHAHGEGYLTQRQQRELARKAREERERELREKQKLLPPTEVKLFVCDRCFKYMALPAAYLAHQKECQMTKPPGRRVYQRGATSIWEIDGAQAKLYCQNLCLFAKLFIEHKYMFFDVESFTFYLLTEAMGKQEWVLGYFSKEKISYDDYNLACIVVFPPFRQRGWATLLIEFSYELSRRYSATPGTPERPLSELGQRGYLAYWISLLVRYFRAVFALRDRPPLIDEVISAPVRVSVSPAKNSQADDAEDVDEAERVERERKKRLRRSKGWDGELPSGGNLLAKSPANAFTLRPLPSVEPHAASPNGGGGGGEGCSSLEVVDGEEVFAFATGLDELAHAVNMRSDDVAYALVESGLARWRSGRVAAAEQPQPENQVETNGVAVVVDGDVKREEDGAEAKSRPTTVPSTAASATPPPPTPAGRPRLQEEAPAEQEQELELVITPELVEEVARQKGVKPMPMLDVAYVCGL